MSNTPRDFVRIFTATPAPLAFVGATALLCASFLFALPPALVYAGALVSFAAFDAVGFHFVLEQRDGDPRAYYRVMQAVWQAVCTIIAYHAAPQAAVAFVVTWWFGAADLLYYVLLREDFSGYGEMSWLAWTAFGFFGFPCTPRVLVVSSVVSVSFSLLWLAVLH